MDRPNNRREGRIFRGARLRASPEQRKAIYESILASSHMDLEYEALLALAALIALFGLLENSAAVIIGAMLISPLMNPILSAALALLLGDGHLGKRSAIVLGLSVTGVVAITWLVASLTPLKQLTPEILSRTSPNLLDLFIAFLSGLAGTLALRSGSLALTILPGVAIAVAVLPPLAVVGYGLSTHQGAIARGAFLLFVTNLVSIVISAAVVFRIIGFQPQREAERGRWKLKYRVGISALVLLLLAIPLFLTLRRAVIEVAVRSQLQHELQAAFGAARASVSDLSFSSQPRGLLIHATLHTPDYVKTDAIDSAENTLRKQFGSDTKLQVDQILVAESGAPTAPPARPQDPIAGGVVKQLEVKPPFDFKQSSLTSLEFVQSELDGILAGTTIQRKAPPSLVLSGDTPLLVKLQLASPEPVNPQTISVLASQLGSRIGVPVQLQGQIELAGAPFRLAFSATKRSGLSPVDRTGLNRLIHQVQQNDLLRLDVSCTSGQRSGERESAQVLSEIRYLFSQSQLRRSQWSVEIEPPTALPSMPSAAGAMSAIETKEENAEAAAPGTFRCKLETFQDF